MQDRIKQMAEEAHNETDEAMNLDSSLMDPEAWSQRMYTLFAQAVARDIIAACHERDLWDMYDPAATVEEVVRARFGIEGE